MKDYFWIQEWGSECPEEFTLVLFCFSESHIAPLLVCSSGEFFVIKGREQQFNLPVCVR